MRKYVLLLAVQFLISIAISQNIGIGTNTPDSSAKLDIVSNTQGFLPPRLTIAQRNAIHNPATGLVIWCIECAELQVFNGTAWTNLIGAAACANYLPTVTICNQVWMLKNLEISTYKNGDPIPQVTDSATWAHLTTGAWCWYNNDSATYSAYGKLYNWYAVNDPRGLAPAGWHVASDEEWSDLEYCGNSPTYVGGALKEVGTEHWSMPNTGATNSKGFTALGGGSRSAFGPFQNIKILGLFWTSTEYDATDAWECYMYNSDAFLVHFFAHKEYGLSVRCVKD